MNSVLKHLLFNGNNCLKCIHLVSKRNINEWHLLSGVCLQRLPLIVPEMNWLEKKMSKRVDHY